VELTIRTSALCCSSNSTTAVWPFQADSKSGVFPA
jgi:hypothetical protein